MLGVNTDSYVESWHNLLKTSYPGKFRKQRIDELVLLILSEIPSGFKSKVGQNYLGLDG